MNIILSLKFRLLTPAPLRRLFDHFPLHTYPANTLPLGADATHTRLKRTNILYVFGSAGRLSLHPTCLRYQALLVLAGIPFETATSNNHASPSGALPFLVTSRHGEANTTTTTISASTLKSFLREQDAVHEIYLDANPTHLALLTPIRQAYLVALYLDDETFAGICAPMYVESASRSRVVRGALVPPLRHAAAIEVGDASNEMPTTNVLQELEVWCRGGNQCDHEQAVYEEAAEAFAALSTILGQKRWFGYGSETTAPGVRPGWLDASVFAYTYTLFALFKDSTFRQRPGAEKLYNSVTAYKNLEQHRDRMLSALQEAGFE
ncbi:MAG: hypothetical protein Q9159_000251 [Coniocarpon cinnabarinum]